MKLNRLRWRMNEVRATKLKDQEGFPHQCCRAVRRLTSTPSCGAASTGHGARIVLSEAKLDIDRWLRKKSGAFPMTMMDFLGRGV